MRRARRSKAFVAAILVAGAGLGATALAAKPGSDKAESKSIVLGKTREYPESGCPVASRCEVVARVTGIQMVADGVQHPFRAPKDGQLVSWWLKLPTLKKEQIQSFNSLFGGDPAARVAVVRRGVRGRFRLIRQSQTEQLRDKLGSKGRVRFRVDPPLRIKEGDYVALSAVTWLPSFAVNLSATDDVWLASRPRSKCNTPSSRNAKRFKAYYKRQFAQLTESSVKEYECTYRTARLIYWARIMPDEDPPSQGGGGTS